MPDRSVDDTTTSSAAWSRRTVLKGAAAGTALWAVPTVTSLGSRAFAGSTKNACGPTGTGAGQATCTPSSPFGQICGTGGPTDTCFCAKDTSGNEVCFVNEYCNAVQGCTTNSDCPSGQSCLANPNGCNQPVCLPCCDGASHHVVQANGKQGGRTAADR